MSTVSVDLDITQVKEAVREYAEKMMPPGWFKFMYIGNLYAADAEHSGYVVHFQPIPESERPKPPPEVAPRPGEVHEFHEVFAPPALPALPAPPALPPIGGFTNNGVMVRV